MDNENAVADCLCYESLWVGGGLVFSVLFQATNRVRGT